MPLSLPLTSRCISWCGEEEPGDEEEGSVSGNADRPHGQGWSCLHLFFRWHHVHEAQWEDSHQHLYGARGRAP